MLRHYFLIIFRNFKRFKSSFFINLIGLSTGLACTLLIYLWVNDEMQVDKFFKNDDRLLQVLESQHNAASSIRVTTSTPGLLSEELAEKIPEVDFATVATPPYWFDKFNLSSGEKKIDAAGIYAGKDYFHVFSYDLIEGVAANVLTDKSSIVISESTAKNLLGTIDNAIGKTILFQNEKEFIVSGVFKDVPANASTRFDFVISFELYKDQTPGVLNWANSGPETFVMIKSGADVEEFGKKIADLITSKTNETHRKLIINPYTDAYLYGNYENGKQAGGRIEYVIVFSLIALFILAIACINFMNLSTAKASRRIKEVGIKKAVGANRKTLVAQYLGESLLLSFVSLFIAVLFVDLLLPQFNLITGKQLQLQLDGKLVMVLFIIGLVTGLIAGSYPALYLSAFNPATVLKGKFSNSIGELWARKGLVVFQFSISVIFIVAVSVIYKQIDFLQTRNLGYDKENVIYFPMVGKAQQTRETFLTEMRKIPGVVAASSLQESMVGGGNTADISWAGKDPNDRTPFAMRATNYDIMEMLDFQLAEGRFFSRAHHDSLKVIFNEAGIKAMGMNDPIGKTVSLGGPYDHLEIVGVVKDFHFESLHVKVMPMFFILAPQYTRQIMTRIEAGKETETIERIAEFYKAYNPDFTFDYRFLDQDYEAQYRAEQRVSILARYFAVIAILISCLGLFGLAAFTAERRIKEIGIRKVLGSSEFSIVYLLSYEFSKMVVLSTVIALPVSYLLVNQWLDNFAYRIPLHWWYFAGAGLLALIIAWLTVGSQAIRAARVNPVHCLKEQ
ncbi:MAG: transporter permease [Azospira oryzae]|nr:MAG: transporter permease [Azospira oryzae]